MSTILVVDDMAIFRDPLAASLRLAGYQTACAADGKEALARVAAGRPDLILLDLAMPVMDGLAFLRAFRGADPANARVPVIVLTAAAERKLVVEAAGLGAREYMLKSRFSMQDMLDRVKRRLADAQAATTTAEPAGGARTQAARPATTGGHKIAATNAVAAPVIIPPAAAPATPATPTMAVGELPRRLTKEQCVERAESAMQAKTMSGVVMQVISMAASPHSDASQLAALVGRDPMLSARVLQAANSAAYTTGRGVITNITEAVRHVGCATIRNIATAVGIFDAMPETSPDGFNPIRCWQHSFAVARLCERLSSGSGTDAVVGGGEKEDGPAGPAPAGGTAYLVGLCHDLGEILFHTQFAAEYQEVMEYRQRSGLPQDRVERAMLGMTHGELVTTILRCLKLPAEILAPIEAAHAALAKNADPRDRLARTLRLAEYYANGLLLASGGGAAVAPLTQVECRAACGQAEPPRPDGVALRAEILALSGMLSGMSRGDGERLMAPLLPRGELRVWLAREATLSGFDPLAAALDAMAHVEVHAALPGPGEWGECDALVVATRSPATAGFTSAEIERCVAARADGRPTPVLWLSGTEPRGLPANALPVRRWPVSLDELHQFLMAAEAASPTIRAAHESRIRAA